MKLLSVFRKSLREQLRGPWALALVLLSAPMMVLVYSLFFGGGGSTSLPVLVINDDRGAALPGGDTYLAGNEAVAALGKVAYSDGQPIIRLLPETGRARAETRLKNREAAGLVVFPAEFSEQVLAARAAGQATLPAGTSRPAVSITAIGDFSNPQYPLAAAIIYGTLDSYVQGATGLTSPLQYNEIALGTSAARTEFETYVPGIIVFSVLLLMFQTAMTVAREVEAGTLRRLQLTRMTAFDLLGGIGLTQILIGGLSVALTFGTAIALGFHTQGSLPLAVFALLMMIISIVGIGLMIASATRTVSEAFIYANFPLMLLMFFSGAVFPLGKTRIAAVAGHVIGLFDFLPPTHAVTALNKVLTLNAGLRDVAWELSWLSALSLLFFALGVWLFGRRHLRRETAGRSTPTS